MVRACQIRLKLCGLMATIGGTKSGWGNDGGAPLASAAGTCQVISYIRSWRLNGWPDQDGEGAIRISLMTGIYPSPMHHSPCYVPRAIGTWHEFLLFCFLCSNCRTDLDRTDFVRPGTTTAILSGRFQYVLFHLARAYVTWLVI